MIAQAVTLETYGEGLAIITLAWAVFVVAFMIAVWGHLAALRRRWAPTDFRIHWETTTEHFGIGIPLDVPIYAIFPRGRLAPVEVFPFTMDGREAALAHPCLGVGAILEARRLTRGLGTVTPRGG